MPVPYRRLSITTSPMTERETEERIDEARRYISALASRISLSRRSVERLVDSIMERIAAALLRGETDLSAYFDEFARRLRELEDSILEEGVALAVARTGTREAVSALLAEAASGLDIDGPIDKYTRILRDETGFFVRSGYPAQELGMFIRNPLGYEGTHGKNISGLKSSVPDVGRGVSWKTGRNTYGLFLYTGMSAHNGSLARIWGSEGKRGYIGFRNSSYPCPLCDSLCGTVRPLSQMVFPAHAHCVCGIYEVSLDNLV